MSTQERVTHRIERIPPNSVTVDLRVQRPLQEARVKKMVEEFAEFAVGVLTASRRPDGTMIYLDGQTRAEALRRMGMGAKPWPTTVYTGLTLQEEAERFRLLNNTKRLSVVDLFHVAVTEEDPIALKVEKAVKTYGWTTEASRKNSLKAVNTLWKMVERDERAAKRALQVLSGTWGATKASANAHLMLGFWMFIERYGEPFRLDLGRLINKIATTDQGDTPQKFLGRCRANMKTRGISIGDAVADVLTGVYNKDLRDGGKVRKVPTWST